jgi:hypothetical protein
MRRHLPGIIFLFSNAITAASAQQVVSPVSYATLGSVYTQNFDGLPAAGTFTLTGKGPFNLSGGSINGTGLTGWQILMTGGSNANAVFAVSTGSSTGNGVYSLGSSGSGERALGSLSSSTGIYSMGLILTNNTGSILNSFTVGFTAEQWRKGGSGNRNTWAFRYKTGVITNIDQASLSDEQNLNFSSVINTVSAASLDGNLLTNQQTVSFTVNGFTWKTGEQLLLRWDDADETGSDDAAGIDNFNFSAFLTSAVPSVSNSVVSNVTDNSATLSGTVNDNYAVTTIVFEYDTLNNFSTPVAVHGIPDTLQPGSGSTNITANLSGLLSGRNYFARIKTNNTNGAVTGIIQNFTTAVSLPTLTTNIVTGIITNTAMLGGNIVTAGGAAITEKGIVWGITINPSLLNNKISIATGSTNFSQLITDLPQGTALYARAYAINTGGVAYGNNIQFTTQTTITSLTGLSLKTNASSVNFNFKTAQNISGLTISNFSTVTNIAGALVTAVTGSSNSFTVSVNTGSDDGTLGLRFVNDIGLSAPVNNQPFTSMNFYTIDKTPPQINAINIPNISMKAGDTIPVSILVKPDADLYKIVSAAIDGFNLAALVKKNDSLYSSSFIITNGGADVAASADIPVTIALVDSAGNSNIPFQLPVSQPFDMIDANKPFITSIQNPPNGLYKSSDTLSFIFHFTEKIIVGLGIPSVTITAGTKTKTALYVNGSGTDSLLFRYIVASGDLDMDGIKTAGTITLNNSLIRDIAGNTAIVSFNNTNATKDILIDGVVPVITGITVPPTAIYKTGNVLDFLVTYSRKVFVNASENQPSVTVAIGSKNRSAGYINGSGSNILLFRYIVQPDDVDTDGIKLISPMNDINSLIKDSVGNRALLTLSNIGSLTNVRINPPTINISNVTVPDNGIYKTGDTLNFLISYNEKIFVTTVGGVPSLKLTIGASSRQAIYTGGSGSNTLLFIYIIQPGEEDTDGIKLASSISFNNGSIQDAAGNIAPVILNSVPVTAGILIDAVSPVINSVTVPVNNLYRSGDTLFFSLHFSKPVAVLVKKDIPTIKFTIGSLQKNILYTSGSGTTDLLFRYVVQPRDLDKNGVSLEAMIAANGSDINSLTGNPAVLTFKIPSLSNIKIDAMPPTFLIAQTETIQLCENSAPFQFSNLLSVADEESSEPLTWKIKNSQRYGSVSVQTLAANSNGKNVTPGNIEYRVYKEQHGIDTIQTEISDGINISQKMIIVNIKPAVKNNVIGPSQIICIDKIPSALNGSTPTGGNDVYKYAWDIASISDSLKFNTANGITDLQQYTPAQLNNTTWFRRRVISGVCTDTSLPIRISVVKNGFWLGKTAEWNDPVNWCTHTLPNNATDVYIYPNTLYAPLISDTARCNSLILGDNAHLTISGILQANGDITAGNNSVQAEKGSLVFSGTSPQNISSKIFTDRSVQNLRINNHTGVALVDDLLLTGVLLLNAGSLNTNDHLTLKHTASIGASASGTFVNGNVSIEHFIKGGKRCFWLFGHPFTNAIGLQTLKDSLDITGENGATNGFTTTDTNEPSAFRFDVISGNDSTGIDAGWQPFTNTNGIGNNAWQKMTGIRLFVRGSPGQGLNGTPPGNGNNGTYLPKPVTIKLSGNVNCGYQEIALLKDVYAGYNVIANPYASNIDLSRITRGSDIGSSYWLWNPQQGKNGGYTSYPARSKNILPPFGAFIAKANGVVNNKMLFSENCKSTDMYSDSIAPVDLDDIFYVELKLDGDNIFWDRIIILQMDSARTGIDKNDAEKFQNSDVNFYSLSREQKMLSIDARPITNESVIPIGLQTSEARSFRLYITKANLSASALMLHDKYLHKWIPLQKDSSYFFSTSTDSLSTGNDRFEIASKQLPVDTIPDAPAVVVKINPVPANDKVIVAFKAQQKGNTLVRILSLSGKPLKSITAGLQKEGQITIPVADLLTGIYLLELRCGNAITTQKIIKN